MRPPAAPRWALTLAIAAAVLAACGDGDQASPLDAAAFQEGYDQWGTMIERAQAGDADGAEEVFAPARQFTGRVSEALADLPAAVIARAALVDVIVRIERELETRRRPDFLATYAEVARRALVGAADALAIERPGEW